MTTASTATPAARLEPAAPVVRSRWRPTRATWVPVLVFLVSRIVDGIVLAVAGHRQIALPDPALQRLAAVDHATPADPGYLELVSNWDGQWYQFLATQGYHLPAPGATNTADVLWSWAFPPGFPMTVRVLLETTGVPFPVAVTLVNLVAGAVGMTLLYRLVDRTAGAFAATSLVALTCFAPTALLFQVAYSESLALALLCAVLLLVHRRRYWWALVAVVALALTRVITAPLAVVVAAHAWSRFRGPADSRPSRREWSGMAALGLASAAGAFLWAFVVGLAVGEQTGATTRPGMLSKLGWFSRLGAEFGIGGPVVLAGIILVLVLVSRTPRIAGLGIELSTWLWCYPLYIFGVTEIHTGILRYLLLCLPLPMLFVLRPLTGRVRPHHVASLAVVCLVSLGLQVWWMSQSFVVTRDFIMP
ncbi:hypothetical protein [Pedococcus soli]